MAPPRGKSNNPKGRPKGIPNKFNAELKDMILGALDQAGGQEYLAQQARDNPGAFMSLVGKILPRDVNANVQGGVVIQMVKEF